MPGIDVLITLLPEWFEIHVVSSVRYKWHVVISHHIYRFVALWPLAMAVMAVYLWITAVFHGNGVGFREVR